MATNEEVINSNVDINIQLYCIIIIECLLLCFISELAFYPT